MTPGGPAPPQHALRSMLAIGLLHVAGCGAPLAAVGAPDDAHALGPVRAYRAAFESEEACEEELRARAAAAGATHVDAIVHHDAYTSGVSYHFPQTAHPAWCEASMLRAPDPRPADAFEAR